MTSLRRCLVVLVALCWSRPRAAGETTTTAVAVVAAKATGSDLASQCPIGAIDDLPASEKPVEITYWHSIPRGERAAASPSSPTRSTRRRTTCGSSSSTRRATATR